MEIPLFDNDLTLTRLKSGRNIHVDAFNFAFREVYSVDASKTEIVTHGMIDRQIIGEVLRRHEVDEKTIHSGMDEAVEVMVGYFTEHQHDSEFEAIPHVRGMLIALKEKGIPRGVLTGNIEGIAWLKLEQAGIRDLLQFGAFGDLASKRADLIGVARRRAIEAGIELTGNNLCIVGDTPLDIVCAKQGRIKSVAVATGVFSIEDLRQSGADLVISSFAEVDKFIEFLTL